MPPWKLFAEEAAHLLDDEREEGVGVGGIT
jgi:hypothetical protein